MMKKLLGIVVLCLMCCGSAITEEIDLICKDVDVKGSVRGDKGLKTKPNINLFINTENKKVTWRGPSEDSIAPYVLDAGIYKYLFSYTDRNKKMLRVARHSLNRWTGMLKVERHIFDDDEKKLKKLSNVFSELKKKPVRGELLNKEILILIHHEAYGFFISNLELNFSCERTISSENNTHSYLLKNELIVLYEGQNWKIQFLNNGKMTSEFNGELRIDFSWKKTNDNGTYEIYHSESKKPNLWEINLNNNTFIETNLDGSKYTYQILKSQNN